MKKKNKLIIVIIIIVLIAIAIGLYFIFSPKIKTINIENADTSSNINANESDSNEYDEQKEENTTSENKEESPILDNSASENSNNTQNNNSSLNNSENTSSNSSNTNDKIIETKPETIESTLTQKVLKTSEGINLKYWLYTPKNPTNNMPLIVYLHGGSARGDDLNKVVEGSFPKFLKNGELGNINAYVIMPQVPSNYKGWSDIKLSVRDLINSVKNTYGINQNKISLTGHSMGGKGTYDIALAYPSLFSCIAPMSGSITVNDTNVNKLKELPIWAFVGSNDTIVNPSTSTAFLTEIKKYNSNSKLTTFDGTRHFDVPELGYKNTDVINWLINSSK